ncbi:MAG: peptide-methionine (S)-S-oxide reductase MsrA [Phycisphaerales bacterium]|nr:peptide-methionine (S)-S-oxide reductase MsrA [Phycisphaerales bacterium]
MSTGGVERVMFGAGCFWGVEARFMQMEGVTATAVGYSGGQSPNPTYKQVCSDSTGHAEVVLVEYDPARIGFEKLLEEFFAAHDPTQVNRQGPDVGSQYRSAIFYYSPAQQAAADAVKGRLEASGRYKRPIATQIVPAGEFWKAEEYHQKYLQKRGLTTCGTGDSGH